MATIAILGPGDLGTRLAQILAAGGHATLASLEGRGERSVALCRERGVDVVTTLAEAVARADVVVSTVPPRAALEAAEALAACLAARPSPTLVLDANSISPARGREVAGIVEEAGATAASAGVHGSGAGLGPAGQLFLSGPGAGAAAALFGGTLRIVELGPDPGRAKQLKLLVAAISKGVSALYLETGEAAARAGLLDEAEAALRHSYPALMTDLDRMVPTYARHSERRTDEMAALADLEAAAGVDPLMAGATCLRVASVAARTIADRAPDDGPWTARSLVLALAGTTADGA